MPRWVLTLEATGPAPKDAKPVWKSGQNRVPLGGINQDAERLFAIPAGIDALPILGDPLHEHPLLAFGGRSGVHEGSPIMVRPAFLLPLPIPPTWAVLMAG